MKCINTQLFTAKTSNAVFASALALMLTLSIASAHADETCSSYLACIDGQEEFVYVWTLGVERLGDGSHLSGAWHESSQGNPASQSGADDGGVLARDLPFLSH